MGIMSLTLKRTKYANLLFRDTVFGFIREHETAESITVSDLARHLCLHYYFLEDHLSAVAFPKLEDVGSLYFRHFLERLMYSKGTSLLIGCLTINLSSGEGIAEYQWTLTFDADTEPNNDQHLGFGIRSYDDWSHFDVVPLMIDCSNGIDSVHVTFNVTSRIMTLSIKCGDETTTQHGRISIMEGTKFRMFVIRDVDSKKEEDHHKRSQNRLGGRSKEPLQMTLSG